MQSARMKAAGLILIAAAVYLVGNGRTQLFDRDEPRYAQCSRQMLQSGDWVVPRLYDEIRAKKPPGIYWCQATAMKLLGDNAFSARLPSSLAMALTLTVLAVVLWRETGAERTLWMLFVFATSALTIYSAKVAMTDSVLLLWTTIALLCIYRLWRGVGAWPAVIVLSISIGAAGLVKGPFILGVLAGTVVLLVLLAALDRWSARRKREAPEPIFPLERFPLSYQTQLPKEPPQVLRKSMSFAIKLAVGLVIIAMMIVPWLVMVHHREPNFLRASTRDAMEHLQSGSEGHTGPPGYHLALIWVTFLPWSILLPLSIVLAFRNRRDPQVRFALAAVLGTWIFVEILQTKLPHYILPAFPWLSFLTADAIVRCLRGQQADLQSRGIKIAAVILGIVALGICTGPWWWLSYKFHDFPWTALMTLGIIGCFFAGAIVYFFLKQRAGSALLSMGFGSLAIAAVLFGIYFPLAKPLRISIQIAQILKRVDAVHRGDALMLDYKEPSLAFYQGGTIREADHARPVMEHLQSAPPWLVLTRGVWNEATPQQRAKLQVIGEPAIGLNYSDSLRPTEVFVARNYAR